MIVNDSIEANSLGVQIPKISRAVALTLSGPILIWTRVDTTGLRLSHVFGSGVGLFFILGALTMLLIMRKGEAE